ncbi:hypothetical protein CHLRE_07g346672v5 [Chlamydomonas reinhardtii]|uniref:Uncharacterized protein n=1 Tax=Chlamydomonas reinhardtii TaxID=3055 RepID=A0A2K3DL00_CHLRE|nr:uncharacterized protein CHLRE_07g346672v5 [Chlamydomonas reinhardtii]PNW81209.1 hypothetical protein CHLRE_07g346672v5 [Chlamydomonas reinhardtii]
MSKLRGRQQRRIAKELQQLLLACKPSELLAPRWAEPPHLRALSVASATLTSLDLGDATTDVISLLDSGLAALPPLPLLRSLSLRRCTAVTDAGVSNLTCAKFPSLTHLDLTSTRVAGASGFASLAGQLQSLVLLRCRAFGDAGLRAVCEQQAGSLTSLVLCGSGVPATGVALWCLQPAARLQKLDLGPSWELDGEGLAALACCPDLRELRLGNFHLVPARLPADNNDNGAGGNAGLPLPGGAAAAAAAANAVAAAGAAAVWLPADQLAAAAAAAAAAAERQPWMPTPAARPLERLRVLRLGGMFAQHGLRLILPRMRRLVTLELSGLSTARDSVLVELVKAAEGAASASKTKQSGRQAQGQGQGQGRPQEQGQLPSRQGSVDSNGSGGGGSVCSPRSGSGYSSGSSSWGRGEDEEEDEEEEMEAAASDGSSGMLRLQELRLVSAGPDLTAAGLLQLAALPRLKRLSLVACPCATEPAVQQLVAAVRGRRDGGGAAVAAAVGAAAGGGGGSGGGGGGGGEVRQPRRRRRLRLEVLARANSSPTGSVGGAGAGAAQPQAEAPAPQVYNI